MGADAMGADAVGADAVGADHTAPTSDFGGGCRCPGATMVRRTRPPHVRTVPVMAMVNRSSAR